MNNDNDFRSAISELWQLPCDEIYVDPRFAAFADVQYHHAAVFGDNLTPYLASKPVAQGSSAGPKLLSLQLVAIKDGKITLCDRPFFTQGMEASVVPSEAIAGARQMLAETADSAYRNLCALGRKVGRLQTCDPIDIRDLEVVALEDF